jgi:hypothetical protein
VDLGEREGLAFRWRWMGYPGKSWERASSQQLRRWACTIRNCDIADLIKSATYASANSSATTSKPCNVVTFIWFEDCGVRRVVDTPEPSLQPT